MKISLIKEYILLVLLLVKCFIDVFLISLRVLKKAMEAASCLKQTLQETKGSSDVIEILKMAVNAGITEDQALMDILFMLK